MTVDGLVLRVSVDEHEGAAAGGAETAQRDAAGRAGRHAVARNAARSDEQAGHFFHQRGHQGAFVADGNPLAADHGHGGGQTVAVHRDTGTGHDGAFQGIDVFVFRLGGNGQGREGHGEGRDNQKDPFHRLINCGYKVSASRPILFD